MLLKKVGVACMKLTGSDERTLSLNNAGFALQTALARMRRHPEICESLPCLSTFITVIWISSLLI